MRRLLAMLLACAGVCACTPPPAAVPSQLSADHEAGRRIYNFRCYFCHGYSGDARTLAASMLTPAPRDFTRASGLDERRVAQALRSGIPGTGMASFAGTLSAREIEQVSRFVVAEFVVARSPNTRYHTPQNGWPEHERYAAAFPFATGEIPLDRPEASLGEAQRSGRRLFMSACISCHDRANVLASGDAWQAAPRSER